jgi:hypothetical protein
MKEDWTKFKDDLEKNLAAASLQNVEDMDEYGLKLNNAVVSALECGVGRRRVGEGDGKQKEYPVRVRKVLQANKKAVAEWRSARSRVTKDPSEVNRALLAKAEIEKTLKSEKTEAAMVRFWNRRRSKVLEDMAEKTVKAGKLFWKHVVNKEVKPVSFGKLEDSESGEMVESQQELKRVVEVFLKNLFQGQFVPFEGRPVTEEDLEQEIGGGVADADVTLEEEFTVKEVLGIVKTLKNNKAMGVDHIPAEAIKNGPDVLVSHLVKLFNWIRESGRVPEVWKTGRVVLVHKPGDKTDMGNYRPLTVIAAFSALFGKTLCARLTAVVESKGVLGELQQGFRKGRCGADNTFVLNTILMMCTAKKLKPHLAFIDIKKVADWKDDLERLALYFGYVVTGNIGWP